MAYSWYINSKYVLNKISELNIQLRKLKNIAIKKLSKKKMYLRINISKKRKYFAVENSKTVD